MAGTAQPSRRWKSLLGRQAGLVGVERVAVVRGGGTVSEERGAVVREGGTVLGPV